MQTASSLLTPVLCRAARAALDLSQGALARAARMSRATVATYERGGRETLPNNLVALEAALERLGVTLLPDDGQAGPGLRLRSAAPAPGGDAAAPPKRR